MITELTKKIQRPKFKISLKTTEFRIKDCLDKHLSMVRISGQENHHLTSDF